MEATNPRGKQHTYTSDAAINQERRPGRKLLTALATVRRPLILGHVTPDADCLGSCLGLCVAARQRGIEAAVGLPEGCVPDRLAFMMDLARTAPQVSRCATDTDFDAVLIVDTASEKRINTGPTIALPTKAARFNIDHHITNPDFADHNWIDPHASSTCEMIARLLVELDWPLSATVASLLYAGIHGDTAGFSLPSTTAESLQVAADLVRAGADVSHIGEQLCRSQGRHDFELLRRVYDHTTMAADDRIAYSFLTRQDIAESGCKAENIDDQVSIPRALRGVKIAILFSEGEEGVVRINLRGEGRTTVVEIAQRFGGGGHPQSAGVRVRNKPMQEVIQAVVAAAQEHLLSHPH